MDKNNFQSENNINGKNNPEVETAHIDFSDDGGSPQIIQNNKNKKPGRRLMWSFFVFIGIFVLVGGGLFVWNKYLSPDARHIRKTEAQYQKYLAFQTSYKEAMKADTYGGKTPQETLNMFVDALKKGNLELASKYFALGESGKRDPKILENLEKLKNKTKLGSIINIIADAQVSKRDTGLKNTKEFVVLSNKGVVNYSIMLELNKYSKVWKIESL